MRKPVVAMLCVVVCLPVAAAEEGARLTPLGVVNTPAGELLRQLETSSLPIANQSLRPSPNVVLEGAEPAFIFPVVGSAGVFRTEAVLVNRRNQSQTIAAYYWPIGAGASNCNLSGRAYLMSASTKYLYTDFVNDLFQQSGTFGSVIIIGMNSSGSAADPNARIDGNARIWSLAAGGGTASQNFPSMSVQVPPGQQGAFGLRSDEFYRTNWGIFNYDSNTRTFDIVFDGLRGLSQISRDIPPCSLIQQAVPGGPYGGLEVVFVPRDGGGLFYAYGSSVDNVSSDAWSVPARK